MKIYVRKAKITGTDGNEYEITQEMLKIFMKTEKTSSKLFFKTRKLL